MKITNRDFLETKTVISWQELQEACKPLKELLQKKGHPHMTIIIDQTGAEVLEGVCACRFELLDTVEGE